MELCDPSKMLETVKRDSGVAVQVTLQDEDVSHCDADSIDSSDQGEIPRVKVETNISAPSTPSSACTDPRVKVEADIADPRVKVEADIADPRVKVGADPRVKVEADIADPRVKVEADIADLRVKVGADPRVKVGADITVASTTSASFSDPSDTVPILARVKVETDSCSDPRRVPRVKMETDIVAAPKPSVSCNTPRAVPPPRVKAEADIAAAPTQSASGCDMVDCFLSDLSVSYTSQVKIEIDVAEETPLSWTVQDPMKSKLIIIIIRSFSRACFKRCSQ